MKDFIKLPFYADEPSGVNFNKVNEAYFNRNAIICFNEQCNELNGKSETIFYLSDESEMYCPLTIDELIEKLS